MINEILGNKENIHKKHFTINYFTCIIENMEEISINYVN